MFRLTFRLVIAGIIILAVIIFFVLPLKLSYTIDAPGKLLPSKEWVISKTSGGQVLSIIKDNRKGITQNYSISEFERGDAVQMVMREDLMLGNNVNKNDTIASIVSNQILLTLAELHGDLETAKADLEMNISGEKISIIKEAEENLALINRQADEHLKILNRQKSLFEKKLISEEEYEISQGTAELNKINIAIAEARLESVKSGSKQQQIDLIKTQISSLEREIKLIQNRLGNYNFIAPFRGIVNQMSYGDTICIISDLKEYVMLIPVEWQHRSKIIEGQNVSVRIPAADAEVSGVIDKLNSDVEVLNGQQVVFASAIIKDNENQLAPGLIVNCRIDCGKIPASEQLSMFLKTMFR